LIEFQESDFNLMLSSFYEGVCYLNPRGEILHYNHAAQLHWHIDKLHSDLLFSQSCVSRALAGQYVNHKLVHLDNHHALLVNTLPLYTNNTLIGIMVISQDMTEPVLMERQARRALEILTEATYNTQYLEDGDEVLKRIAALIPELESVDNSIAFRLDDTTGKLIPVAFFSTNQQSHEEWHKELVSIQLNTEHLIHKPSPAFLQAIHLARTFKVDFTLDTRHSNPRKLRAAIYAPVFLHGRVVGLLGAERHRPLEQAESYFPQWSDDLLTALARLASMSMENAALLASIEHLQTESGTLRTLLNQKEEYLLLTSHELKNPLTSILGQAQIMQRRLKRIMPGQAHEPQETNELLSGLSSIEHQTRRIEHMINTLVEVSRIGLDRLELYLEEVDLLQLIRHTIAEHLPFASKHEFRLLVHGEPVPINDNDTTTPVLIQADEKRIEEVLTNLISNAIKYSPQGGPITVALSYINDDVTISIEDQGIGVPPDEQARLIERFYRAENAMASSAKGLGLGLYLVHTLVTKHGGQLSIKSKGIPGKGSVFTISLPGKQS
jgi:signal transduction histidine kinase